MKDKMAGRMEEGGDSIFWHAATEASDDLKGIRQCIYDELKRGINKLVRNVSRDYHTAIVESQMEQRSQEQIKIQNEVMAIVNDAEGELQLGKLLADKVNAVADPADEDGLDFSSSKEEGDMVDE